VNAALVTATVILASTAAPAPTVTDHGIGEGVLARGVAVIRGDVAAARQAAIDRALADALRCRRGTAVTATRRADNHVLTESRVRTTTTGSVATCEVISESQRRGTYRVVLRALFEEDVDRRRRARRVFERTRLVIRVTSMPRAADRAVLETALIRRLADAGFALGLAPAAEPVAPLTLHVRAALERTEPLGRLVAERCTLAATVVRPPTDEVVASTRVSVVGRREVNASRARPSALDRAARDLADRIIVRLRRRLTAEDATTDRGHAPPPSPRRGRVRESTDQRPAPPPRGRSRNAGVERPCEDK